MEQEQARYDIFGLCSRLEKLPALHGSSRRLALYRMRNAVGYLVDAIEKQFGDEEGHICGEEEGGKMDEWSGDELLLREWFYDNVGRYIRGRDQLALPPHLVSLMGIDARDLRGTTALLYLSALGRKAWPNCLQDLGQTCGDHFTFGGTEGVINNVQLIKVNVKTKNGERERVLRCKVEDEIKEGEEEEDESESDSDDDSSDGESEQSAAALITMSKDVGAVGSMVECYGNTILEKLQSLMRAQSEVQPTVLDRVNEIGQLLSDIEFTSRARKVRCTDAETSTMLI